MGTKGIKATNIYQNPGIKNNPGIITDPSIKGVGSPAKLTDPTGAIGLVSKFGGIKEKEEVETPAKSHTAAHTLEQKKEADKLVDTAIELKKSGETNPNITTIGDPEDLKKDKQIIDSTLVANKILRDSLKTKSTMSAKDKAKAARDRYKDFFNN